MAYTVVDTVELVRQLLEDIQSSKPHPPFLFIDLEGVNLSRHGSIAIMQVLVPPNQRVYLVDVHTLKSLAFETFSSGGSNFKDILESNEYAKVFFDVRSDSDALYSHYQVNLKGVVDLQLFEFTTRRVQGRFLKGLSKCIDEASVLTFTELREWQQVKDAGRKLFAPELGGRYEVFHQRPLPLAIANYCVQDVLCMPKLLIKYAERLQPRMASKIHEETIARVTLSQSSDFNSVGRHMAIGPTHILGRTSTQTKTPPFPMSIICSQTDLANHCTLQDCSSIDPMISSKAAENSGHGKIAAVIGPEPTSSTKPAAKATASSLSENLEAMTLSPEKKSTE